MTEPVSRDRILRCERGQGNIHFLCSADHEQDCQPYPVDPYSAIYDDHTYFPVGIVPESPSGDAVNGLSSRLSRSIETRRRYGWLRMVFPGAGLFRGPIWCPSGGGGTREAGSTVAESLVALYRMGTHQIRRGRRAARSSTSQGRAEPLRARNKGANREVSGGKVDL